VQAFTEFAQPRKINAGALNLSDFSGTPWFKVTKWEQVNSIRRQIKHRRKCQRNTEGDGNARQ
jgi:hypothetical protein